MAAAHQRSAASPTGFEALDARSAMSTSSGAAPAAARYPSTALRCDAPAAASSRASKDSALDASARVSASVCRPDASQNQEPGITHASHDSSHAFSSSSSSFRCSFGNAANPYARKVSAGVLATPYVSNTSSPARYARDALSVATFVALSNRSKETDVAFGEWFSASAQGTNASAPYGAEAAAFSKTTFSFCSAASASTSSPGSSDASSKSSKKSKLPSRRFSPPNASKTSSSELSSKSAFASSVSQSSPSSSSKSSEPNAKTVSNSASGSATESAEELVFE